MGSAAEETTMESSSKAPPPIPQPLMDLFWDLAEIDEAKQLDATAKLVGSLREDFDTANKKGESASAGLEYTLTRLVRGLASNRKGVRWGFGTALTVLLQEFSELKTSKVLLELENHLKIVVPSDIKTIAVGQLTVLMAIVNSGRMATINASHLRAIVDILLKLETEKTYLRAGVHEIFLKMIEQLPSETFQRSLLPLLKGHLTKSLAELDLDGLVLLLKATQFHQKAMESSLKQSIGTGDLLDAKNIDAINKILFQTSTRVLHRGVLDFAVAFQLRPDVFPSFWTAFVQCATKESAWKAKIPFEVIPALLTNVTEPKQLLAILTQPFLFFLLKNSTEVRAAESESLKAMHMAASSALTGILAAIKATKDQTVNAKILNLLLSNEAVEQTSRSWSGFVSGLIHRLDAEQSAKVADKLVGNLKEDTPTRNQVVKVLESILTDKIKTVEDVARFGKLILFFEQEALRSENDASSVGTARGLLKYLGVSTADHHRPSPTLDMADVEKEVSLKVAVLKVLLEKSKDAQSTSTGSKDESNVANANLLKSIAKLPIGPKLKATFELMALATTTLWIRVRPILGQEILAELTDVVAGLIKVGKKLTDETAAGKLSGLLLTLLAVERAVFATVELVFKSLCPFLGEDAVSALFDLVEPAEEEDDGEGQPIDFESSDEEDDDDMSDVEESGVEEEEAEVLAVVDRAALEATGAVETEDTTESEPDLDDAAMFKLDDVLSGILRSRKAAKNGGPAANEVDARFRALRLVHLFFSFPHADPLVILPFLRSVIRIANERVPVSQRERQSQMTDLSGKVLQSLKQRRKFDADRIRAGTSREDLAELMGEVIEETGKVQNAVLHRQCVEAVLFVQRVLAVFVGALKKSAAGKAVREIYLPWLERFAGLKTCMFGHLLWNAVFGSLGEHAVVLLPNLVDLIFSEETIVKDRPGQLPTDPDSHYRKYQMIRQVQLCGTVKIIITQSVAKATGTELNELKEFFTKFGQEYVKHLKNVASSDGPLKGKKLLEDITDLARFLILYHRKLDKHAAIKLQPLEELWSLKKLTKSVDQLLGEKLAAKELKAVRKAIQNLKQTLDAQLKLEKVQPDDGAVLVNGDSAEAMKE
ncbi:hypothetical protein BV898_14608 [Hypsibius exemplaris]|uniref:DNA polymerase V n=1 Tax=Hypsibius exemplaris TaxID=2072580 RepID=A0A9X6N973_HYPEX|nr:hypothetical protein BV898_14608 [Hypsibius exemplaris]